MSDEVAINTQDKSKPDENEVESANATSIADSPSPLLKLDVDCFEELFEWVSLADLRAMRQTCKRLQKVVDYFIRLNYPTVKFGHGKIKLQAHKFNVIKQHDSTSLKMIKELEVWVINLKQKDIEFFSEILPQIEILHIGISTLENEFYESILKHCSNLKKLSICNIQGNRVIGDEDRWLLRKYPTLQHIKLDDTDISGAGFGDEIEDLTTFFELNPNIQIFSSTFDFVWANRDRFLGSNIKIDQLNVTGDCFVIHGMDRICSVLNKLYDQGFYKRVHMYPSFIYEQVDFDEIVSVRGMEKLYLSMLQVKTVLPSMPEIRELALLSDRYFEDLESVARNLLNLERIFFKMAKSSVIAPFLRCSIKLKEIKIDELDEGLHFTNDVIDLTALNKERGTMKAAAKVTIYVQESIFLATKFANSNTNLSLVTLKRAEAVEWKHEFN